MSERTFSLGLVSSLIILSFTILLGRLYFLQVVSQPELGEISSKNSIRRIPIDAARGLMLDRNNIPLVDNQPLYSIQVLPAEFDFKHLPLLSKLSDIPEDELKKTIKEGRAYSKFVPVKIKRDISFSVLSSLEENLWKLPGVDFAIESKRKYLDSVNGSHLFGYTRVISKKMLKSLPKDEYARDDIIGYNGLEKTYEQYLRGRKGERFVLVNSLGKVTGKYENGQNDEMAVKGNNLHLTIDAGLQALAERSLAATEKSGAIVAIDPTNGEILAMCSYPDYDPSLMSGYTNKSTWQQISNSEGRPLFNRATQTRYPPGSTYKLILALAALEEKLITPKTSYTCTGYFHYGNRSFMCHGGIGHGKVDLMEAIEQSCNVYFYNLIYKVGLKLWAHYGALFGFGALTGIDLPDEQTAPLPTKNYFDKRYGARGWTQGYLVSLSIGQGEMGASPLQMAAYTAAIANKGTYHTPHLVKGYTQRETGTFVPITFESREVPISERTFNIVRKGMRMVVETGTARRAQIPGIAVAGKTGTAQNPHGEDHAWFISFAPYENPKIAVAVLVENAGYGGSVSAPIARDMMAYYLQKPEQMFSSPKLEEDIARLTP
jgi:penicillin-binding protein 2